MEYTIQKLGQLAGISTRTLRYYDEIDLLKPARINSSGYRIYGAKEVDQLQQILFYRELNMKLEDIKEILTSTDFDIDKSLQNHYENLVQKRIQLDKLIENVEKTILYSKGVVTMADKEKFEGFKEKMVEDNEKKYGKEIRNKYGDSAINKSNQKLKGMTEEEHKQITDLTEAVMETLKKAFQTGDPASELAQEAADLHRQYLSFYWDSYSKEAHANIAQMYVDDERFKAYYDKEQPGLAQFLRDAVKIYTNI